MLIKRFVQEKNEDEETNMGDSFNRKDVETEKKENGRHHHHHSHRRRSKGKFAKFLTKHKSFLGNVAVILVAVIAVIAMGIWADSEREAHSIPAPTSGQVPVSGGENGTSVKIEVPFFPKELTLVSGPAVAYMKADISVSATAFLEQYRKEGVKLDVGTPVNLGFDISGLPVECMVVRSAIEVSENAEYLNSRVYVLKSDERDVKIYHLKTNTQYYYRISIEISNGTMQVVQGSFKTAETPRILSIEGAVNVRDVGGWKTIDGRTIRQGMLYRGSELDGAVQADFKLSEQGRNDMLTVLGVASDLDLRASTSNPYRTDALGANVKHVYFDVPMYSSVFESPEKVRAVFAALADPSNYPVYLHCTYGMDRTGTFCYLLGALLGMHEDDLMRDYQLSALSYPVMNDELMEEFVTDLRSLEGKSMQEKVTGYLLSVGVTENEIASIKEMFIE